MNGPGKILQQARKKKRYSIEKIHKITKIKTEYIIGLENDDPSLFPAEVYFKNFLRTYAQVLELNPTEIISMYETAKKQEQEEDLFNQQNNKLENKFITFIKSNKKIISNFLIAILCLAILIVFITILCSGTTKEQQQPEEDISTKQEIKVSIENENSIKKEIFNKKLSINAIDDTWLRISADNKKIFEGFLLKGQKINETTSNEFIVKIGNVDGVTISFNNKPIDILTNVNNTSRVKTITLN